MLNHRILSFLFAVFALHSGISDHLKGDDVDFNRDIRPILSDKCNFCHGPDENTREADLRLDERSGAEHVLESGEILERIFNEDADYIMPPPESKLSLSKQEKELLQKWVDQGAPYAKHWAFEKLPAQVDLPSVESEDWCKEDLDRFVLARINDAKLEPNPEASPLRWLRRVTMDLTGLPPTEKEIVDFEKQLEDSRDREAVYAANVDRLLESKAFGEQMSIGWLDLARYADSYGYQSDKLNTQWPYRDWVVNAINDNLPYDEFLTWQLAGDLLESPTQEQVLATAFNRIHRLNNEGGAVFEEWRIENVADRVHTFGTAFLGLTLECCRCHDHKYDPIPMRDYYALSAFFNSIDETGVYDRTAKVPCPSMLLPNDQQSKDLESARETMRQAEAEYANALKAAKSRWQAWTSTNQSIADSIPDLLLGLSFDQPFDNAFKEIYHPSESDRRWTTPLDLVEVPTDLSIPPISTKEAKDVIRATDAEDTSNSEQEPIPTRRLALQLDGERGITTEGIEPFDRWTPFTVIVTFNETKRVSERSLIAHHTRGTDCGYNGWDLTIVDGYLESRLYRVWPGNAIGVRTKAQIPKGRWHQLAATYDASSKADGLKIFLNGAPLATEVLRDQVKKSANVKVDHGGQFVVGQRFRAKGFDGALVDDVRVYSRNLSQDELSSLSGTIKDGESLSSFEYFASAVDAQTRDAFQRLNEARKAFVLEEEAIQEIPIMDEMESARETHILARGQYDAATNEDTKVDREVLDELLLPFPEDAPRNRLGLAKWLTDPAHPLTSRVAVNHLWGNFFTHHLVRTPENFGLQGELPTHPQLLDWLARDFVSHGWDVKRFCKQVVLSATYRQDSTASAEALKRDPENIYLARGSAHRYAAEQIRDLALAASGLLNDERGGPPVSPYQPGEDLWKEANGMSPAWTQSVGKALYRRSLYSVWKRTVPLPNMLAFDSTTREVCTVKRSRTNTPLQALVLLNDVQFVEAARVLAQNVLASSDASAAIRKAFIKLTGRAPSKDETAALIGYFQTERAYFAANKPEANKLLQLGDSATESTEESDSGAAELAAMTTTCQVILNLDATIWKR